MNTLPSPEPQTPSPLPLPPTTRDFEIHRLSLVEFLSTRRIAEKFEISQTRVRQIVDRVSEWLADMLPSPTEADQEKQKRFAIHLAAAQLQNQIELLHSIWTGTADPKYLRQQTRAILALARLGVAPGKLDALAAEATEEVQGPMSKVQSQRSSTLDLRPETLDFPPPPLGDCSPLSHPAHPDILPTAAASDPTVSPPNDLRESSVPEDDQLAGLNLIEKRLLTLLDNASPDDHDRRQSLAKTLATVRRERATYVLQLSPNAPPCISTPPAPSSPGDILAAPAANAALAAAAAT